MKGITPASALEIKHNDLKTTNDPNILKLPAEIFEDFKELDIENDELFEYLCLTVIINYLKKCCLNED